MEYTRQSSQPATVDLVRADLAEVWTVYDSEFSSPKRPASVSGISDMLDLEFIPTPGFRPSKTAKRDKLAEMLVDVLELSPSRKRGRYDGRRKDSANRSSNEAPNPADAQTATKAQRENGDAFELSDSTDAAEASRPKKRPAKQPSSAKPRASTARKPCAAGKATDPSISQKGKPSRVPKKPLSRDMAEELDVKADLLQGGSDPNQQGNRVMPRMTQWNSHEESESGRSTSSLVNTMTAEVFTFSNSPEASSSLLKEDEPVPSAIPQPLDVVNVSSTSGEEGDAPEKSASPLFISEDQVDTVTTGNLDILVTVKQGTDDDQRGPRRGPGTKTRLNLTTPAPSQTQPQVNEIGVHQQRGISDKLPSGLRDAFFSDEKPAAVPSPLPEPGSWPETDGENINPEDIWKQTVGDDKPPEVLCRVVTLLHRSLKPKEEIIRDIASDYESNASRLLHNLNARHLEEKAETLAALRKALRAVFSVFSGAGLDMANHIENLRELEIAHAADTLRRPALAEKLDAVTRLCQTMLNSYCQEGPLHSSITDDGASGKDEGLDNLEEAYRAKLLGAVQRSNSQALESHDEVSSQVHEYITRCLGGESKKTHQVVAKKPGGPARTADEALEVLLNRMIGRMQQNGTGCGPLGNNSGTVVDIASETLGNS
ncbi:uncharacterized protein B0T15DRAFT_570447 [Chaetomium strumarium]|uniref:Uncharacterized protein n=1 Tax=Chaetomium strumarium TaxID=1170767 RepID=A0AAJ0H0U1_9PEZI|nr:hypothetical protein B0T15DRAFT_570447 [Chaetomium strumarium]